MVFAPDAISMLRRQLFPSVAYYLNWSSIYGHTSYFQQTGRPPLLLHLWSLAVEEQFYLIWPVVVLLVLRRYQRQARAPDAAHGGDLRGAAVGRDGWRFSPRSTVSRCRTTRHARTTAPTRHASGLMLGAALACIWPLGAAPKLARYERNMLDAAGAAALCWLLWIFHSASEFSYWLYRGGFLLYSAVALVVVAVVAHPQCRLGQVMAHAAAALDRRAQLRDLPVALADLHDDPAEPGHRRDRPRQHRSCGWR